MANFESGIKDYVVGKCEITVYFPVDFKGKADISCKQCQYFAVNSRKCVLNNQMIAYPNNFVGDNCPLENVYNERSEE